MTDFTDTVGTAIETLVKEQVEATLQAYDFSETVRECVESGVDLYDMASELISDNIPDMEYLADDMIRHNLPDLEAMAQDAIDEDMETSKSANFKLRELCVVVRDLKTQVSELEKKLCERDSVPSEHKEENDDPGCPTPQSESPAVVQTTSTPPADSSASPLEQLSSMS